MRDTTRDSMFLQAVLRPLNGTNPPAFTVRVRNLSSGGLMAESDAKVAIDDRIAVELRNIGQVDGKVVWVRASRFGVTFETTIDPKLARKQTSAGSPQPVISSTGFHRTTHPLG